MNVLEQGILPEKEKPIWTGMRIRCPKCRALIEFSETDRLTGRRQYGIDGPIVYDCPTQNCNTEIHFSLPKIAKPPVTRDIKDTFSTTVISKNVQYGEEVEKAIQSGKNAKT